MSSYRLANPDDDALSRVLAVATASFPLTTLSTGTQRMRAAILAAGATNTCIRDENADVVAVTFVTGPVFLTSLGKARLELEAVLSPGN